MGREMEREDTGNRALPESELEPTKVGKIRRRKERRRVGSKVVNFFEQHKGMRRIVMFYCLVMNTIVVYMGWQFAGISKFDGTGTALIIAAFTAPFAIIQTAAFKDYLMASDIKD